MKEKFRNTSTRVEDEYNKIRTKYEELKGEVEVLKKRAPREGSLLCKIKKNKQEVKAKEEAESKPDEVKILLSEKLVSLHDIKKSKRVYKKITILLFPLWMCWLCWASWMQRGLNLLSQK